MKFKVLKWIAPVLTAAAVSAAQAQVAPPERPFKFVLLAGLTGGGDKLATIFLSTGATEDIRAGQLFHVGAGLLWQPPDVPVSIQTTIGYHVDTSSASNTDTRFSRYPIELLGFYNGVPRWRFGGGFRFVNSPEYKSDLGSINSVKFDDTVGGVFEIGYALAPAVWLSGRFVTEKFKPVSVNGLAASGTDVSGNHGGVYISIGF